MNNYLDAEQAVMGSILIDPRCLREVQELLTVEDFGSEACKAIYRAALLLDMRGEAIDPIIIRNETEQMGCAVPAQYLVELMDATPTAANVREYAKLTRENALRRGVAALVTGIQTRANQNDDPHDMLADLSDGIRRLEQDGMKKGLLSPMDLASRWMDHRIKVDSGQSAAFVPTGYRDLDYILGGGLIASGMHVLAARPGMGKTTFALNIAERVAQRIGPVLFVSLEMDDEQISAKRLARESGIPGSKLLMNALTDEENMKMANALEKMAATPSILAK